ncbi:MAG: glutamate--tRNA ligase [Gemmatimonadota bacterium]|nr:glutamate--tRNA ligase [Gemmatimonadota bacterium]
MTDPRPRVRFAPSPTGYLHVGGARTALFNYLFARRTGGRFLLRIEDTDRERSSDAMTGQILSAMEWLGLEVDGEPVHQGDGLDRHRADVERLREAGWVWPCFAGQEELAEVRARLREEGRPLRPHEVPGHAGAEAAARLATGEPHALFFRVPDEGATTFDDVVHGPTRVEHAHLDDFVVLRTDGTPVYNLAVVSDDLHMGITHVIRGDDHLSNTPKQVLLYRALGAELPTFVHVPMILGPDGRRLSKRHGATSVEAYREQGILPEALVNFLALLGWSPGDDREVMDLPELVEAFSLARILKKSSVFDPEKLAWLNGRHLQRRPPERLAPVLLELLPEPERGRAAAERERLLAVTELVRGRARTVEAMAAQARPFFTPLASLAFDARAADKHWKVPSEARERLLAVRTVLAESDPYAADTLEPALRAVAERLGIGAGKLFQPLRVALMGSAESPGIFDVLVLLGRRRSLERIDRALEEIGRREAAS